ncbi:MAG: hypothetical protein QW266_01295 [Sulfolobales archaeon]
MRWRLVVEKRVRVLEMVLRHDGGVKCPVCDGRAAIIAEKSVSDGGSIVRYLLKCSSCGYRDILQEVTITKLESGLKVRISSLSTLTRVTRE